MSHVFTPAAPDLNWQLTVLTAHTFVTRAMSPRPGLQVATRQRVHLYSVQYTCTVQHCTGERLSDGRPPQLSTALIGQTQALPTDTQS